VTRTLTDFEQVVFADFEFVARPGEHPDVVCLAWHEASSGQTYRLWRDHLGSKPPYRIDDKTLFVCFVGNAELSCHLALGWALPANILDLNPEFRCIVNGRTVPAGKGLLGALAYYGLDSIGSKRKDDLRSRIMKGWPFNNKEREEILLYCTSDAARRRTISSGSAHSPGAGRANDVEEYAPQLPGGASRSCSGIVSPVTL
jgi:hypothetical protein